MRYQLGVLVIALLTPSLAAAQSTTADGIAALARGDTAAAVRILRPLAESSEPDPLAQFFLATMYSSGSGVALDEFRACGLYLQSATAANPLASQAMTLADAILQMTSPPFRELCSAATAEVGREPPLARLAPGPDRTRSAGAQANTADGIEAFVRRDYQRAVEILKPIAERWQDQVDGAAVFFMAAMYANGLGLPQSLVRSCAVYFNLRDAGPFARLNTDTFSAIRETLAADQWEECQSLASLGFDHRFEPARFILESGHWIAIDLSSKTPTPSISATITYQGKENRTDVVVELLPGLVFLPIEHTELLLGGPTPWRRHFVELFTWVPEHKLSAWHLQWSLSEVVKDDLVSIALERLLTAAGHAPPASASLDPHSLVSVRVNAAGAAEWAILSGPNMRSEVMETEADRAEMEERRRQQEARRVADDRVDWKQVRDPDRPPSFRYADADGCAELFAYSWSDHRAEVIAIRVDKMPLQLSSDTPRTFDLATHQNEIEITVDVFERPQRSWDFCTDVGGNDWGRRERWRAVAGTVTIELGPPGLRARQPFKYRATIQIDGAECVGPTGVRIRSSQPIRVTAFVGGFSGG
jgi:TPR repeat protein